MPCRPSGGMGIYICVMPFDSIRAYFMIIDKILSKIVASDNILSYFCFNGKAIRLTETLNLKDMTTTKLIRKEMITILGEDADFVILTADNGARSIFLHSCYFCSNEAMLLAKKGITKIEITIHHGFFETQKTEAIKKIASIASNLFSQRLKEIKAMQNCHEYERGKQYSELSEFCYRKGISSADEQLTKSESFILGVIDGGKYTEESRYSGVGGWMGAKYMVKNAQ